MLDNIAGFIGLFVGSSAVLFYVTKPRKDFGINPNQIISFKGAMKYSPAAMRAKAFNDEMHMH